MEDTLVVKRDVRYARYL